MKNTSSQCIDQHNECFPVWLSSSQGPGNEALFLMFTRMRIGMRYECWLFSLLTTTILADVPFLSSIPEAHAILCDNLGGSILCEESRKR
jgi:hypothetical protein